MKILIINQHVEDYIGGSEIQCDIIARNLSKLGHEVVYGITNSKKLTYNTKYETYSLRKLSFFTLNSLFKKVSPDLTYWRFDRRYLLYAGILCKIYKIKLVFSISSIPDTKKWGYSQKINHTKNIKSKEDIKLLINFIKNSIVRRINYNGYYFVDGLVSLSRDLLWEIPSKNDFLSKRTHIYNSMESITDYEFKWERPYIVWVANLKKIKNPELYIMAATQLIKIPIDFLIVGKIQDRSYEYINNKNNLPPNCYYLGANKPIIVNSIIKNSLFVVHTCNREGFGNIFIQAWLQSKPTISLYFDPDNLIQKYKIGLVSHTFEQFCKDIKILVENEKLRSDMGGRAKLLANELFDPEKNTKKIELFFKKVMNDEN